MREIELFDEFKKRGLGVPVMIEEQSSYCYGAGMIKCPVCEHGNLHIDEARVVSKNIEIDFRCENCGFDDRSHDGRYKYTIIIGQYEGNEYIGWVGEREVREYVKTNSFWIDQKNDDAKKTISKKIETDKSGYYEYLKSEKWKIKRELVMSRTLGVCEGCRAKPAVHVHHLSYRHIGDEFLWELVAVCKDCHERYHAKGAYEVK